MAGPHSKLTKIDAAPHLSRDEEHWIGNILGTHLGEEGCGRLTSLRLLFDPADAVWSWFTNLKYMKTTVECDYTPFLKLLEGGTWPKLQELDLTFQIIDNDVEVWQKKVISVFQKRATLLKLDAPLVMRLSGLTLAGALLKEKKATFIEATESLFGIDRSQLQLKCDCAEISTVLHTNSNIAMFDWFFLDHTSADARQVMMQLCFTFGGAALHLDFFVPRLSKMDPIASVDLRYVGFCRLVESVNRDNFQRVLQPWVDLLRESLSVDFVQVTRSMGTIYASYFHKIFVIICELSPTDWIASIVPTLPEPLWYLLSYHHTIRNFQFTEMSRALNLGFVDPFAKRNSSSPPLDLLDELLCPSGKSDHERAPLVSKVLEVMVRRGTPEQIADVQNRLLSVLLKPSCGSHWELLTSYPKVRDFIVAAQISLTPVQSQALFKSLVAQLALVATRFNTETAWKTFRSDFSGLYLYFRYEERAPTEAEAMDIAGGDALIAYHIVMASNPDPPPQPSSCILS